MKKVIWIQFLFFPLYVFATNNASDDWKKEYTSVIQSTQDHSISAHFVSVGGYSGNCVAVDMSNNTSKEKKVLLEAGDKLMCENEEMQNIFITQTQYIVLAPMAKKRTAIYGFCCASTKSAPTNDVSFAYADNTNEKELKLAAFLNKHKSLDLHAVQHAVWVVCNDANMDGIYAEDPAGILELKQFVATITGREIPWYSKKYDVDSTGRLQETSSKLIAIMDFNLNKESLITVQICNSADQVLKVPMQERMLTRGHYDYQFTWETSRLPKGTYVARVFSDGQMIQERSISL